METIGPVELLIILGIVLLLFGSTKLPEIARNLGRAASELRAGLREEAPSDRGSRD